MMREKSRARRRVRTRVALFLSLASLAGLYLIRLLGAEVNPIPVKAALAKMGYGTDTLRLPLTPMEEGSRAVLLNALEAWGV